MPYHYLEDTVQAGLILGFTHLLHGVPTYDPPSAHTSLLSLSFVYYYRASKTDLLLPSTFFRLSACPPFPPSTSVEPTLSHPSRSICQYHRFAPISSASPCFPVVHSSYHTVDFLLPGLTRSQLAWLTCGQNDGTAWSSACCFITCFADLFMCSTPVRVNGTGEKGVCTTELAQTHFFPTRESPCRHGPGSPHFSRSTGRQRSLKDTILPSTSTRAVADDRLVAVGAVVGAGVGAVVVARLNHLRWSAAFSAHLLAPTTPDLDRPVHVGQSNASLPRSNTSSGL
ncbi:unnamed protein product [Protopolystoma xenopodis]|uniref:Uncharacterized protein n=1 Tax=Protopolystoma xenopodis TaxID=117903 RepID=A0A448WEW4_9PLAT|nr:unnamed protein product [Protopolystoma xenopodis]